MKKNGAKKLDSLMDIKIFLVYLLDNIRYPIDYTTLSDIISQNVDDVTLDYEECLADLVEREHIWFDAMDGERYYMISDSGRTVAAELYDVLDPELREKSVTLASRYVSVQKGGAIAEAEVKETADRRYVAHLVAKDSKGVILDLSITVSTKAEADMIAEKFRSRPDGTYRGVLFAATGRFEFFS